MIHFPPSLHSTKQSTSTHWNKQEIAHPRHFGKQRTVGIHPAHPHSAPCRGFRQRLDVVHVCHVQPAYLGWRSSKSMDLVFSSPLLSYSNIIPVKINKHAIAHLWQRVSKVNLLWQFVAFLLLHFLNFSKHTQWCLILKQDHVNSLFLGPSSKYN